jgi:hypothetical protein
MTPFQCDKCHFVNIQKRAPVLTNRKDCYLMKLIRRANLDACWAREPSTVAGNLGQARKMEKIGDEIGFDSVSPKMGPFPVEDSFGMKIACTILHRTLDPGKHEEHIQFATARKIRSAYSNVYHASRLMKEVTVMAFETNKLYETSCPTYGYWFERFILGCHKRMGDIVVSDYALSKDIYLELMNQLEEDWDDAYTEAEKDKVATFANLLNYGYLCGLRGEEIMKTDISGFLKYLDIGASDLTNPHVIVPLIGRLKGETGERYHMMVLARVTTSGVMAGRWADRMGRSLIRRRRRNGFMFVDAKGNQAKIGQYDDEFTERLTRIKMLKPHLFEPGLNIVEAYSLRRSLRRGSTSEAINRGVPKDLIEMNNRWRKFENSKGRRPGMSMIAHYTEIRLMIASLWKYSRLF